MIHCLGVDPSNRPRLPLAGDNDGTGDFAYMISPSMVLIDVLDTGGALCQYCLGLEGPVMGVTRSIDFDAYEPCVLGGRGRWLEGWLYGVYGSEKLYDEAGVCDREGAALKLAEEVDERS